MTTFVFAAYTAAVFGFGALTGWLWRDTARNTRTLLRAAEAFDALQTKENDHWSRRDPALWLEQRAARLDSQPSWWPDDVRARRDRAPLWRTARDNEEDSA